MVTNFKKNIKGKGWSSFLLHGGGVAILAILVFLAVTNLKIYQKKTEYMQQISNLKNQIKNLQESNDKLEQGIKSADDTRYIEKIAREELDLQKPGEQVVSFIMPKDNAETKNEADLNGFGAWLSGVWKWIQQAF